MAEVSLVAKQGAGEHFAIGTTSFELRVPADQLGGAFGVLDSMVPKDRGLFPTSTGTVGSRFTS